MPPSATCASCRSDLTVSGASSGTRHSATQRSSARSSRPVQHDKIANACARSPAAPPQPVRDSVCLPRSGHSVSSEDTGLLSLGPRGRPVAGPAGNSRRQRATGEAPQGYGAKAETMSGLVSQSRTPCDRCAPTAAGLPQGDEARPASGYMQPVLAPGELATSCTASSRGLPRHIAAFGRSACICAGWPWTCSVADAGLCTNAARRPSRVALALRLPAGRRSD